MPGTNFIILFQGRSGSSWIIDALGSHPRIVARGEELVGRRSAASQISWMRDFFRFSWLRRGRAAGFKTKLLDVADQDAFADQLRQHNCRVIELVRRNTVKQTISWIRSDHLYAAHGRYNTRKAGEVPVVIPIDVAEFNLRLGWIDEGQDELATFVENLHLPVLRLFYEDLLANPQREFLKLQQFIGVAPQELRSKMVKITGDDISRAIGNFSELRDSVESPEHRAMFDEQAVPSDPQSR